MVTPKSRHQLGQQFTETICLNIPVVQAHPDDFHHSAGQCSLQNMKRAKCHLLQLLVVSKSVADHDGTLHQFQKQSGTVFFFFYV